MLLNRAEYLLMNNPVRAALQRYVEGPRLYALARPPHIRRALEIGCGRGVGLQVILDRFGAETVEGFDLDLRMVRQARDRTRRAGRRVRLWVGDAASIAASDAHYDAVFDFGILHHVPDWQGAVREVARVLRPGGVFYGEEVLAPFLRSMRHVFRHPQEGRFDAPTFARVLSETGFERIQTRPLGKVFAWFTAARSAPSASSTSR